MGSDSGTVRIVGPQTSSHVELWAEQFEQRGWRVRTIGLSTTTTPVARRRLIPVALAERRRRRPDLCIVHSLGTHGLLGAVLPPARRTAVVPWGSEVEAAIRSPSKHWAASLVLGRADLVLTTSHAMADAVARHWPALDAPVEVRSWGVADAALADRTPDVRAGLRARLGLSDEHLVVLAPRGLGAVYRHDEIRNAFATAQAVRPQLRLVEIDTTNRDRTRGIVRRTGTTLTLPRQDHGELLDLLAAADAVVSVPRADQRSTTVVEAIASGTPVLLGDVPAYRELADEGARVTLLAEPVTESLVEALTAPAILGVRLAANREWAGAAESRSALFDQIVHLCTGDSR